MNRATQPHRARARGQSFTRLAACGLIACAACSSRDDSSQSAANSDAYLGLTTPTDGFQVRSIGTDIPAGADTEYCEVGQLPGQPTDAYYVKSFELGNALHSHHLIITAAEPGSAEEQAIAGVGVGNRVECLGAELKFGAEGLVPVAASQQPYASLVFPEGVGREFSGGQYIVFDYHYLNTENETIAARSAINFHLSDPSSIEHLAHPFGFQNFTIDTPVGETRSFTAECRFHTNIMVSGLTRHTHRWGTNFAVWFAGGSHDGEPIWTTTDWQHDTDYQFPEPVLMGPEDGFKFQCDYTNDSDHELRFGTSATDEMCILFGLGWTAGGEDWTPQSCAIAWTDADGVGHPATEAGGFPKATADQASLCESALGSTVDDCGKCRCSSCAAPLIQCATDTDCSPILKCFTSCTSGDCINTCQSTIDQHSSAVGLLSQTVQCLGAECPMCGSLGGPADAGAGGD